MTDGGGVLFYGLFFGLFGMALLWLILCQVLFHRLAAHDPVVFSAIGEPHIIMNNALRHVVPFTKLLFSNTFAVTDPPAKRLIRLMRVYILVYLAGFFGLIGLLFLGNLVAA